MIETSDSWLGRLKSHDAEAWRSFLSIYEPFIRRSLKSLGVTDPDEVASAAVAAIVESLPEFQRRRVGSFRKWVRIIVYRCALARMALARKERTVAYAIGDLSQIVDDASELSRSWDLEHDRYVLSKAIETARREFGERIFAAFVGTAVSGRPTAEVASELNLTLTAVYVYRHRVSARVQTIIRAIEAASEFPTLKPGDRE